MTINQAFAKLLERRARHAQYKRDHWPEFVSYMRGYMRQYRATPKGRAVCRKAHKRWLEKNKEFWPMYLQFYQLSRRG